MTTEKIKLINTIVDRIKTEREKHPFIDWEIFAAQKIYDTLITYWQEKTRWKSLEKEPPTNYTYDKMYLLRTESGRPYLLPLPYEESVEDFISCGFIEWKEIE